MYYKQDGNVSSRAISKPQIKSKRGAFGDKKAKKSRTVPKKNETETL